MNRRRSTALYVAAGLLVALLLAFLVAPHASSSPDGLQKVAVDQGLGGHSSGGGLRDQGLSIGVAGIIGVTVVFAIAFGLAKIARASRSRTVPENVA